MARCFEDLPPTELTSNGLQRPQPRPLELPRRALGSPKGWEQWKHMPELPSLGSTD